METNTRYFFCYNDAMVPKFRERGIRYITRAYTEKGLKFFLYEATPAFQAALAEMQKKKVA